MDTPQLQQLREEMRQMITDSLQAFQNQQHAPPQNQPAPQQQPFPQAQPAMPFDAMSRPLKSDEVGLFF
jgi:hypothetical protein